MTYTLPELGYDYAALEPYISAEIMQLHHDKHHATYVKGANDTVEKLEAARDKGDFGAIVGLEKTLAFNLAGHVNHTIFWKNMAPQAQERPDGELAAAIDEFFGSFDNFKAQFTNVANTIQGSGWAMLCYDLLGKRLNTYQVYDHQSNFPSTQVPVLLLDMWEHSFYLQYKNVKADYVTAWWNVANWADAGQRFANATAAKGLIEL